MLCMARKKTRMKNRSKSKKWLLLLIPILLGLAALGIQIFSKNNFPHWITNLLNWSVGVGLVGGVFSVITFIVASKMRKK